MPVIVDSLSAWFILTINFTIITGAVYGFNYMKRYREKKSEITLHCIAFLLIYFALLGICSVQNGFIFLLLWELMALSAFILVIFEHEKPDTIKAGLNYLVQSHFSIVFIMLGFFMLLLKPEVMVLMQLLIFQIINQFWQEQPFFSVFLLVLQLKPVLFLFIPGFLMLILLLHRMYPE